MPRMDEWIPVKISRSDRQIFNREHVKNSAAKIQAAKPPVLDHDSVVR